MVLLPDNVSMKENENRSQRLNFQRFLQYMFLNVFKWVLMGLSG